MKPPPLNKWFKTKAKWCSFSTDGDSTVHKAEEIIAIRYGKDEYSFIHKGQSYLYESLCDFDNWELIE